MIKTIQEVMKEETSEEIIEFDEFIDAEEGDNWGPAEMNSDDWKTVILIDETKTHIYYLAIYLDIKYYQSYVTTNHRIYRCNK